LCELLVVNPISHFISMVNTCLNIRWYAAYKQQITWWWQSKYWCKHKLTKIKSCNRIVKGVWKKKIYRHPWVTLLTVLLATHFRSLRYLPAISAGAPVRCTRLRSRMDLDFFHFLAPINWRQMKAAWLIWILK
jgi:hypothetical protein